MKISEILRVKYNIDTEIHSPIISAQTTQGLCEGTFVPEGGPSLRMKGATLLIKNSSKSVFTETIKPHLLGSQMNLLKKPALKLTFGVLYAKRGLVTLSSTSLHTPVTYTTDNNSASLEVVNINLTPSG